MIIKREDIEKLVNRLRQGGKKIVFTNGCFDIIHAGHIKYLAEANKLGDVLFIGLNSDDSVRRLKGSGRPINTVEDRAEVLDALRFVDYISVFDEDTPYELIKLIIPDVLAKGGDYNEENVVGADIVKGNGGIVEIIPYVKGKSTTAILKKLEGRS